MTTKKLEDHDTNEITVIDKSKRAGSNSGKDENRPLEINFTIIHGEDVDFGKHYHFTNNSIIIGRDTGCAIRLKDEKISKNHCRIDIVRDLDVEHVMIKDLGSTNGTYINGEIVQQAILKSGDKITIGDTVLRLGYHDELEEEYHARLFNFAATDGLTGLYNRRYILNELDNQGKIARRNKRIFCIVIIDIDDFKNINDTYGHLAGDEYLKKFSFVLSQSLREQDICGRIGGEEFLIVLPETATEGAVKLANRIRERIVKTRINHRGNLISTTLSAGISQFGTHGDKRSTLFRHADIALQKAKDTGKNKVLTAYQIKESD
ncbi:MAG: GGDEF domain-containing protein [bacterium]|nr:GGDEF domain-containing protein [bacterium]